MQDLYAWLVSEECSERRFPVERIGATTRSRLAFLCATAASDKITAVSPSLKPTIDCFAVNHTLHAISGKIRAKHGISRHGMSRPKLVHS